MDTAPSRFRAGDEVFHDKFGVGLVIMNDNDRITVRFGDRERRVVSGFLTHTATDIPFGPDRKEKSAPPARTTPRLVRPEDMCSRLKPVTASTLAGKPVPERDFLVPELIVGGTVNHLSADGGTGKSLLALQLGVAMVTGGLWLNLLPKQGPVVYLSAEDELDELHRRLDDIARHEGVSLADLQDLHLLPMAGEDAVLAAPEAKTKRMTPTAVLRELELLTGHYKARLVVLDTLADVFGGNEIDRYEVRQFVGMLRGIAQRHRAAIVIIAHPSLTGIASGTGLSGSTAWNNSVRSRLYLERDEVDNDVRILTTKKANYSHIGTEIRMRWQRGVFVREGTGGSAGASEGEGKVDALFLDLLRKAVSQGQDLNTSSGRGYAPSVLASMPGAKGVKSRAFVASMQRLLDSGAISIVTVGPPSKLRKRLVPTGWMGGG